MGLFPSKSKTAAQGTQQTLQASAPQNTTPSVEPQNQIQANQEPQTVKQ